jgi:Na+/H+ antiporter NhaB
MPEEVPPVAACFTAREANRAIEQDNGDVVIATIAGVVLVVALASVCASSSSTQCSLGGLPPPPH